MSHFNGFSMMINHLVKQNYNVEHMIGLTDKNPLKTSWKLKNKIKLLIICSFRYDLGYDKICSDQVATKGSRFQ